MHKHIKFGVSHYGIPGRNKTRVYKLRFDANVNTEGIKNSLLALKLVDWVDTWNTEYKSKAYNNICFACIPNAVEQDYQKVKAVIARYKNFAVAQEAINKINQADKVILA